MWLEDLSSYGAALRIRGTPQGQSRAQKRQVAARSWQGSHSECGLKQGKSVKMKLPGPRCHGANGLEVTGT